jgi:hypothetical protein
LPQEHTLSNDRKPSKNELIQLLKFRLGIYYIDLDR